MNLLIVDDSKAFRDNLSLIVKDSIPGIEVYEAEDVKSAQLLINDTKPDFITLDISMPQKNGISFLREIKTNWPKIIVAMLTNYSFLSLEDKCYSLGADYFFDKTFGIDELILCLKECLRDYA